MATTNIQRLTKDFTPTSKEVRFLNKTFPEFRQSLIDFAKVYFPNTHTDFNETSPGMMFIEMAAFVGDVLSYYIDTQFRESLVNFAEEDESIINIAQAFGFRPKPATAAFTIADVFQLVPAQESDSNFSPDSRFFLKLAANSVFQRSEDFGAVDFRNTAEVDFSVNTPESEQKITVFSIDANNSPLTYLIRKRVKLEAGTIKTITRTFTDPTKFSKIELPDESVLGIIDIKDSNGNVWSEVDFLAADVIIEDKDNIRPISGSSVSIPPAKIIKFLRTPRRFITRYNSEFKLEIIFGSGVLGDQDELISLDSSKIASDEFQTRLGSTSLDPADFLSSNSFGLAPSNTELTITYIVGGGIESNVPANTINKIRQIDVVNDRDVFTLAEQPLFDDTIGSLAINNPDPAIGGKGQDTIEEIRQSTLAFFNSQNRLVTSADYKVRVHAMPPRFGGIAKSFVIQDDQLAAVENTRIGNVVTGAPNLDPVDPERDTLVINEGNPRLVNVYVLGFDENKRLRTLNLQVKQNLKQYLAQFKMMTDQIQIIDAFVVNIGVKFKIIVFKNQNVNIVLATTIDVVKDFFDISRWDINQPIIMNDLNLTIASIEGVQSVTELEIFNRYAFRDGGDYESFRYDIKRNALDENTGIVFPSLDPMIFEVRFPDSDIIGSAIQ